MTATAQNPARRAGGVNVERPWKQGLPPEEHGYPGFEPRTDEFEKYVVERDVVVPLADGGQVIVDVYRTPGLTDLPAVISWSPYGKHKSQKDLVALIKFEDEELIDTAGFESLQPAWWCPRGYALIAADPRGCWGTPGDVTTISPDEAADCAELIEWAGTQEWSNGKVAMAGASYPAMIQWNVAALQPPRLAAINPWEAISDLYRDLCFHGGIMNTHFQPLWWPLMAKSRGLVEDIVAAGYERPLFDEYWAEKVADWSKITVPAYVGASWTDQGIHTRGTLEAFKALASDDKFVEIHGQKKFEYYYLPDVRQRIYDFFERFLKGADNDVKDWPRVRMEIRERKYVGTWREESEWPLARTDYQRLYLDASSGSLSREPVSGAASTSYDAESDEGATFDLRFDEDTELTGHAKLRLWVEADGADDMELFVALQKLDENGEFVPFLLLNIRENGSAAYGWLRVSHRQEDAQRSTDWQPYHTHTGEQLLSPGEIVPVNIEILPTSTLFRAGETLRVLVKGKDVQEYPRDEISVGHWELQNRGRHVIHTGGEYDSHVLIPVVR